MAWNLTFERSLIYVGYAGIFIPNLVLLAFIIAEILTIKQKDIQIDRQRDIKKDRQTDRKTNRQTDGQAYILTDIRMHKQAA